MKTTSFNNPRIEKNYALLKAISDQVTIIQPLVSNIAYLATIEKFGYGVVDSVGNLTLEDQIHALNEVRLEIAEFVTALKKGRTETRRINRSNDCHYHEL